MWLWGGLGLLLVLLRGRLLPPVRMGFEAGGFAVNEGIAGKDGFAGLR